VQQVNATGGIDGHKVEIVTKDDQTTAQRAVMAFQDLHSENVQAVLGGPYNEGDMAMDPLAERYRTPLVELTSTTSTVVTPKPYTYEIDPVPRELSALTVDGRYQFSSSNHSGHTDLNNIAWWKWKTVISPPRRGRRHSSLTCPADPAGHRSEREVRWRHPKKSWPTTWRPKRAST
jgi:hypothetical protein